MDIFTILLLVLFVYVAIVLAMPADKVTVDNRQPPAKTRAVESTYLIAKETPEDLHAFIMWDKRLLGEVIHYKKTKAEIEVLYKFPDNSGLRVREGLQGHGYRTYTPYDKLNKRTD